MHRNSLVALASIGTLAFVAACADQSTTGPTPSAVRPNFAAVLAQHIDGNPSCSALIAGSTEFKINNAPSLGTYGPITITAVFPGGISFTSTQTVLGVIMKGGPVANFYDYRPDGTLGDTELFVPINPSNDSRYGTSHVSFCLGEPVIIEEDLTVFKTAAGTYEQETTWKLEKNVDPTSHSGVAGQPAGTSTWEVIATMEVGAEENFEVKGTISITNGNTFAVTVNVSDVLDDGTIGAVDCDVETDGAQNTGVVVAAKSATACAYVATAAGKTATKNTATVTATAGYEVAPPPFVDDADVAWTLVKTGDQKVTLDDDRNPDGFPIEISDSKTVTYDENFVCPSTTEVTYVNGEYKFNVVNVATLKGDNTDLSDDATVNVTCINPWKGETATGDREPWRLTKNAPSTWFMYTKFSEMDGAAEFRNLIAGQHYDIGDITATRNGTTTITIVLHDITKARLVNVANNVKVNPMSCATNQKYVQPGQFSVKKTYAQNLSTIVISGLANTDCYGLHLDVERFVAP